MFVPAALILKDNNRKKKLYQDSIQKILPCDVTSNPVSSLYQINSGLFKQEQFLSGIRRFDFVFS
jgi:hypothetical protein